MPDSTVPTILLVDDHSLMREGLRHIFSQNSAMKVVGEARNGREALELVEQLQPDVVLMDISMPDMNGIEATRRITESDNNARIIALSIHTDRQFVIEALRAGVLSFLPKNCSAHELFTAVSAVMQGAYYFSDPQCALYAQEFQNKPDQAASGNTLLTSREREVLQLMAEGKSTKETANSLDISIKTVEFHRTKLMKKLELYSIADLTKYAVREGITEL